MSAFRVEAAAKINLTLRVGPVRADGYHEVVTVLQSISLVDELQLEPTNASSGLDSGFALAVEDAGEGPVAGLPAGHDNLVLVAARRLAQRFPGRAGARFRLRKRIPVAAGLGGGSADAAATLVALDRHWGLGQGTAGLREVAAKLGADVPFCLDGGTQLGTGRGDELRGVPASGTCWWVLGIGARRLATAAVYRRYDELGLCSAEPGWRAPTGMLDALAAGDPRAIGAALTNDLERAAFDLLGSLAVGKRALLDAGALGAVLAGSGPTLLGLAGDAADAERIAARVDGSFPRVVVAHGPVPGVSW